MVGKNVRTIGFTIRLSAKKLSKRFLASNSNAREVGARTKAGGAEEMTEILTKLPEITSRKHPTRMP
jgi:uncharacterized protein (UPF0128 family)